MNSATNRLRALGGIETRMAAMHDSLAGTTQGSQVCVLKGALTVAALRTGALALHAKYQALRCAIRREADGFAFVELAGEPDVQHVMVSEAAGFRGVVHDHYLDELNRPLDASTGLWRLLLVNGPGYDDAALIMTCHHAIMDGSAMFVLADELLGLVDRAMTGTQDAASAAVLLAPAIDSFLSSGIGLGAQGGPSPAIPHRRVAALDERRTFVEYCDLPAEPHRRLRRRCAAERISVNAVIAAAIARSFAALGFGLDPVPLKTAISLRQLAPEPYCSPGRLGCYISVASTPIAADASRSVVELAQSYESTLTDAFVGTVTSPGATPTQLTKKLEQLSGSQVFAEGVGLTNVGKVSVTREFRHFRMVGYAGAANRRAGNVVLVVSPSSFDEELGLPITFTEPAFDRSSVRHFATHLLRELGTYTETVNQIQPSGWMQDQP